MSRWIATRSAILGVLLAGAVAQAVLTLEPAFWFAPGLGGVGNVVVSPDGRHVYATSERAAIPDDGPTVVAMARDASGALSFVQVYSEGPAPGPLCGAAALAVSPDGRHVYVVASCAHRVRVFARDQASGILTPIGAVDHEDGRVDGLDYAFQLALAPDGTRRGDAARLPDAAVDAPRDRAADHAVRRVLARRLSGVRAHELEAGVPRTRRARAPVSGARLLRLGHDHCGGKCSRIPCTAP